MDTATEACLGGRLSWIESGQGFLKNEKHKIGKESGLHLPKWNDSRTEKPFSISRRELWQENRSFTGNYWYYQRLFKIDLK